MGIEKQQLGAHFPETAEKLSVSPISIPKIREVRDMVYGGTLDVPIDETTGTVPHSQNKVHRKRNISPFFIILVLLGVAIISVFYIGNILAVGQLMAQINQLQIKHRRILNEQELLKSHINRLAGLERIQRLAFEKIGLQNSKQLPLWIEIDPERINEVEEIMKQQMERAR